MSPRHDLMLLWEEFDNLAGRFEIGVVGITGWVAPLLRRAHPVSQMAYPRENVIWPGCNVLQLPEPRGKTFAVISTTTSLHTPSRRRKIEIMSYSTALKSFFYGCSSFFAGLDAGWLWLAAPRTSRNARLLPLWFSKLSRLRAKMAPEWASPGFVIRRPLSQDGGQHGRPTGAQLLNLLQRVCVQPVPRKRQPPTPQNLTSAFPLTSILSTYRLFICHSPETVAANLLRFDCHGWADVFPHTVYQKGGDWEFQSSPKFPWAFREVPQQGEWYLAIHRKGVTGVCDFIRGFSLWSMTMFRSAPKVNEKRSNDCNLFAGASNSKPWAAGGIYSGVKQRTIREVCFWRPLLVTTIIGSNPLLHFDYVSTKHEKMWEKTKTQTL